MLSDELTYFVDRNVPCMGCGYNLRGVDIASRCPECGAEIVERLREDLYEQWFLRRSMDTELSMEHLAAHLAMTNVGAVRFFRDAMAMDTSEDVDLSAAEIVELLRRAAVLESPEDPVGLLRSIGFANARDVGNVMFALVDAGLMRLSPGDARSDFDDIQLA